VQEGKTIEVLHEFYGAAKANLSRETWDYLMGGADTETTLIRNRMALDEVAFRPRVLRNVGKVDTGARLIGHSLKMPIVLAPIGSLQDLVKGGGEVVTKAAAAGGVMHMLSSVCAPGLEEVAAVNKHPKIFQLYVRGDAAWVDAYVERAVAAGYAGLALTVDLDYYGRRERDIAKRYKPTARRASASQGAGDPHQARFSWADITRIKKRFDIPLILKGIATAEDAIIALEHGVKVIYVSNHGGRQLDHGKGGLAVLPEVVEAVGGRAEVVVDGGFMRGADVVKAMAMGSTAVGIGRLQGLAAAAGGETGVVRMLELLHLEMMTCLGLLGVTSFAELNKSYLARAEPVGRFGFDSAFPLLKEGY
jgi:isopentenyl diphosphate isomerase/L-lactate dehydrogenase-like FMN-dependent dehydrogenase